MENGGASVKLTTAEFLGMMPSGVFVYACTGESWHKKFLNASATNFDHELIPTEFPDYLARFKIKISYDPKILDNIRPEALEAVERAKRRQLAEGWAVHWG